MTAYAVEPDSRTSFGVTMLPKNHCLLTIRVQCDSQLRKWHSRMKKWPRFTSEKDWVVTRRGGKSPAVIASNTKPIPSDPETRPLPSLPIPGKRKCLSAAASPRKHVSNADCSAWYARLWLGVERCSYSREVWRGVTTLLIGRTLAVPKTTRYAKLPRVLSVRARR